MQKWLYILIGLIGLAAPLQAQLKLGPVGSWRAHFSNESIQQPIKSFKLMQKNRLTISIPQRVYMPQGCTKLHGTLSRINL
jgi:hypothetical protein